jgi:hypothetical protein
MLFGSGWANRAVVTSSCKYLVGLRLGVKHEPDIARFSGDRELSLFPYSKLIAYMIIMSVVNIPGR